MDEFCQEKNMTRNWCNKRYECSCVDSMGEIHVYKTAYNATTDEWMIGNERYEVIWVCE